MVEFCELWDPDEGDAFGVAAAFEQAQANVRGLESWTHPYHWATGELWGLPQ